ncbi:MAG: hypothetical protein KBT02_02115 [Treponema sp.]|nr:hypothetical protein [Candidatus Treponema caballi]
MTNKEAIKALETLRTYTAAGLLDVVTYVTEVIKKLDAAGISDPLNTDFTPLKK